QEAEPALAAAGEDLGVQAVGLVRRVGAVALDERPQALGVAVAVLGERWAQRADVRLVGMAVRHLAEGLGEVALRALEQPEVVRDVHLSSSPGSPGRRRP